MKRGLWQVVMVAFLAVWWGCGGDGGNGPTPTDVSEIEGDTAIDVEQEEVEGDVPTDVEEEEVEEDAPVDVEEEEGGIDLPPDSLDGDIPDEEVLDVPDLDVQPDTTDLEEEEEPPACQDPDGDGRGTNCDLGADCDESSALHWSDCGVCVDQDEDGRGANCDLGADCTEYSPRHWSDCDVCVDIDGDGHGPQCDLGGDCALEDGRHWADCGECDDDDGDGYGTDCDLGQDCDEDDPLIHPRALDLPSDGIDSDCSGADLVPADALGVFVSTATGTSDATGSRTDPLDSIQAGIDLADTSDLPYVFVEQGDYTEWLMIWPGIQVIGGFSDGFDTWDPSLHTSRVQPGPPPGSSTVVVYSWLAPAVSTSTAVAGLTIELPTSGTGCSGIDASASTARPSHALTLSHLEIDGDGNVCNTARGIALADAGFDCLIREVEVHNLSAITLSNAVFLGSGRLVVMDSVLTGGPSPNTSSIAATEMAWPTRLTVTNTVLNTTGGAGDYGAYLQGEGGTLDAYFAHDVLVSSQGQPVYVFGNVALELLNSAMKGTAIGVNTATATPTITMLNNALDMSAVLVATAVDVTDLETLHACAWAGCTSANGNIIASPLTFIADPPFHLPAASPLEDTGLDIEARGDLELPLVAQDIDGDTRPQGSGWDIGIDEVTE